MGKCYILLTLYNLEHKIRLGESVNYTKQLLISLKGGSYWKLTIRKRLLFKKKSCDMKKTIIHYCGVTFGCTLHWVFDFYNLDHTRDGWDTFFVLTKGI